MSFIEKAKIRVQNYKILSKLPNIRVHFLINYEKKNILGEKLEGEKT